jgi:hypothetical protein
MAKRYGWPLLVLVLVLALALLGATGSGAAERKAEPGNPANAELLSRKPAERAAELAKAVGHWCIGTEAFPMGVTKTGKAAGFAYWSLRCADGSAWAVQIDPLGELTAIDCVHFNAEAGPKACFKKF